MSMETVLGNLLEGAGVKAVYGTPVTAGDVTVVPVAKVAYGFGGGQGTGRVRPEHGLTGEGSGGGGGFVGKPVGYIEITPTQTRFVAINDRKRLAAAVALGVVIGLVMRRCWRSCA